MKLVNDPQFGEFYASYQEAALWASTDDDGQPLDQSFLLSDIDNATQEKMREDCAAFWEANRPLIVDNPEGAGHDFWLTRNHEGAGFWDGDWADKGEALTQASHAFGTYTLLPDGKSLTGF